MFKEMSYQTEEKQ